MEQSSLFNSGFLGAHFNWWVGQIVDDSTWRDNISSNKFERNFNFKFQVMQLIAKPKSPNY